MIAIGDKDKSVLKEYFSRHRRLGWEHGTDFLMVSPLGYAGIVDGKHLPLDECHKAMKRKPEPHRHGPECNHEHP